MLDFLPVDTRRVFMTPVTDKPDRAWMVEQFGALTSISEMSKLAFDPSE